MKRNKTGGSLDRPGMTMCLGVLNPQERETERENGSEGIFPSSLNPVSASSTHILSCSESSGFQERGAEGNLTVKTPLFWKSRGLQGDLLRGWDGSGFPKCPRTE